MKRGKPEADYEWHSTKRPAPDVRCGPAGAPTSERAMGAREIWRGGNNPRQTSEPPPSRGHAAAVAHAGSAPQSMPTAQIEALLLERERARARKDFRTADEIRQQLGAAGVRILDASGITGAPVLDDGKVVGILSQTDLLYKVPAERPGREMHRELRARERERTSWYLAPFPSSLPPHQSQRRSPDPRLLCCCEVAGRASLKLGGEGAASVRYAENTVRLRKIEAQRASR